MINPVILGTCLSSERRGAYSAYHVIALSMYARVTTRESVEASRAARSDLSTYRLHAPLSLSAATPAVRRNRGGRPTLFVRRDHSAPRYCSPRAALLSRLRTEEPQRSSKHTPQSYSN